MSIQVKFTPIAGGRNDVSGVCSILEIGPFTLLLDCGCSIKNSNVLLSKIKNKLSFIGKSIDAVILSHADLQHLGALPVVLGPHGIGNPQIVCTLPVHKFGQLVLYDYCSNKEMEGMMDIKKVESNNQTYGYDDIDDVFLHPTVVKFSQIIELSSVLQSKATLSLCAYPSGRTIGGAIWRIWYGSTEILYAVDINMKNEIVLSGASLHPLPTVPSLLIMDAGTSSQLSSIKPTNKGNTLSKKKKDKDDPQGLISTVMETLRNEGNVLIPCETAGRSLELFQILGNHWNTNKIGLYHLIFLSPMAYNVLEFARSQLEWMSDNLSKAFYNGGPNPFYLPSLKISTSLRDVEKNHPGPKVVLCTDASLSCGLSKEVLLRWGGDPRCKIIFTDISDQNSLAYELRSQVPPIVATISRPIRVELTGEELQEHRNKLDKVRKDEEEKAQRLQRESELEFLASSGGNEDKDEEVDGRTDYESSGFDDTINRMKLSQSESQNNDTLSDMKSGKKRKLVHSSLIARFAQPDFPMFGTREINFKIDEYGVSNDDLVFTNIESDRNNGIRNNSVTITNTSQNNRNNGNISNNTNNLDTRPASELVATKIVSTSIRVQFTCAMAEIPLSGRSDLKVAKFVVTQISPSRLIVLRGSASDCDSLITHAFNTLQITGHSPVNGEKVEMTVPTDRVRLQIPAALLRRDMRLVRGTNAARIDAECAVSWISGSVIEVVSRDANGLRTLRLQPMKERIQIEDVKETKTSEDAKNPTSHDEVEVTKHPSKQKLKIKKENVSKKSAKSSTEDAKEVSGSREVHPANTEELLNPKSSLLSSQITQQNAPLDQRQIALSTLSGLPELSGFADLSASVDNMDIITSATAVDDFFNQMFGSAAGSTPVPPTGLSSDLVIPKIGLNPIGNNGIPYDLESLKLLENINNDEYDVDTAGLSISVGEITLNSIKSQLENKGYLTEFRLSNTGAVLVCDGQVIIRKSEKKNHFTLEGPPVKSFWDIKKIISDKLVFIDSNYKN